MLVNKVLVIAAHPDDELLGCAGTIKRHLNEGDSVSSVIVCEGESLRNVSQSSEENISHSELAAQFLGVNELIRLGFLDQRLDTYTLTDIITPLEDIIRRIKPNIIYCQYGGDINLDHEILFKAIMVATRPTESFISEVLAFDTASSTEWSYPRSFIPDTWIDITNTLEDKLKAMSFYESELRDYPHPRSLEALENKAKAWGNQICVDAAEVFMTIRRCKR